jgi:hypothetical protein
MGEITLFILMLMATIGVGFMVLIGYNMMTNDLRNRMARVRVPVQSRRRRYPNLDSR